MQHIEIYDTTLRDGAQSEGINFSVSDKLKIISLLDMLHVDFIEVGWPGANPKDVEVFEKLKNIKLKHSKLTAFGCTKKANISVENDAVLSKLADCPADYITIFGKTWDFHVTDALNISLEENLAIIKDSIEFLISKGKEVFFDAEHFFDGYTANSDYALQCLKTAKDAGATRIILCDTNGSNLSNYVYNVTKNVCDFLGDDVIIGIHAHNDSDFAVSNSIASVQGGAKQVQGTINGYGERCGNSNLCSVIPILQLKNQFDVIGDKLSLLTFVANSIAEIANVSLRDNQAFVGRSAFTHKAGIHASGIAKNSRTYEHVEPQSVGNVRKILVSDQAGAAAIKEKLANLPLVDKVEETDVPKILEKIKNLEWQGYAFEGAEASFELLILETLGQKTALFDILGFRIIGDTITTTNEINTEASVKVKVGDDILHTVAEGEGPVNALDMALKKALTPKFPKVLDFKLDDFKVRILNSKAGTAAKVRVNIETTDGFNRWDTVGVSENIIEASYIAIVDSLLYGLILSSKEVENE